MNNNGWRAYHSLIPYVPVVEYTDTYGNLCQRLVAPVGEFSIQTLAEVMTSNQIDTALDDYFVEIQNLPESVLGYLLPSRYCESDRFGHLVRDNLCPLRVAKRPMKLCFNLFLN